MTLCLTDDMPFMLDDADTITLARVPKVYGLYRFPSVGLDDLEEPGCIVAWVLALPDGTAIITPCDGLGTRIIVASDVERAGTFWADEFGAELVFVAEKSVRTVR